MPFSNIQTSGGIAIKDEGVTIASLASSLDFAGAGVAATASGSAVTATVAGSGTLSYEVANETPNDVITSFTFTHSVGVVFQNGIAQFTGSNGNLSSITTVTAVFKTAPPTGSEIVNGYSA